MVLKKMAEILKQSIRSMDVVYRFGGEEFVILLPATISSRAMDIAEKIRAKIEATEIEVINTKGEKVILKKTISIGCMGTDQTKDWDNYDDDIDNKFLGDMFRSADLAVNSSKKNGRNMVTPFSEELLKQ